MKKRIILTFLFTVLFIYCIKSLATDLIVIDGGGTSEEQSITISYILGMSPNGTHVDISVSIQQNYSKRFILQSLEVTLLKINDTDYQCILLFQEFDWLDNPIFNKNIRQGVYSENLPFEQSFENFPLGINYYYRIVIIRKDIDTLSLPTDMFLLPGPEGTTKPPEKNILEAVDPSIAIPIVGLGASILAIGVILYARKKD